MANRSDDCHWKDSLSCSQVPQEGPWGHTGKHRGWSAGTGNRIDVGRSPYCGFSGKKQARKGKQV